MMGGTLLYSVTRIQPEGNQDQDKKKGGRLVPDPVPVLYIQKHDGHRNKGFRTELQDPHLKPSS